MGGTLVEAYGALLEEMWSEYTSYVSPHHFKLLVDRNAPDLQHDSVKFLTFILEGLHQDLNLVKVQPDIKNVSTDGRSDRVSHWYLNVGAIMTLDDVFPGYSRGGVGQPFTIQPVSHCSTIRGTVEASPSLSQV